MADKRPVLYKEPSGHFWGGALFASLQFDPERLFTRRRAGQAQIHPAACISNGEFVTVSE